MKRITRNHEQFDVLDLFNSIGRVQGYSFDLESSKNDFIARVENAFNTTKENPITIYGRRVESMFGYIIASLGQCKLVKQEDAGDTFYSEDNEVQPPDYRVVTRENEEFLVEVKNCNLTDPAKELRFQKKYLDKLIAYSNLFDTKLKFAIYWNQYNSWTFIDLTSLIENDTYFSINFMRAMKTNEMCAFGDKQIATVPPIKICLSAFKGNEQPVDQDGNALFKTDAAVMFAGGGIVKNKLEQNLAFYFMMFSEWIESRSEPVIENGKLTGIIFQCEPREPVENQEFQMLGYLSSMISSQYKLATSSGNGVALLSPKNEPNSLGIVIPDDYKGEDLKLWRFILKPNYDNN